MRKVFVGSLPNGVTDELLRAEFGKYGQVQEIFVKPGCEPGRQWAFVTFATAEQAQFVKETCDRVLVFPGHDRPCDVMLAKNQGFFGKGGDGGPDPVDPGAAYQQAMPNGYSTQEVALTGRMPAAAGSEGKKIFVGSLPDGVADETLRTEFSRYGSVEDIFIQPGCGPGQQWAFVTFTTPDQATAAVDLCNGLLQFPSCLKPCEVSLAHSGQDRVFDAVVPVGGPLGAGAYDAPNPRLSENQIAPKKIFVGSLPDGITDPVLRAEFSKFGQITDLYMKTTCESNRQWAFITFANSEQAQFARNSCDKVLIFPGSDRPCEVTMARHQGMFGKESIEPAYPGAPEPQGPIPSPIAADGPRKVFVGSLPDTITDADLRTEFSKYGRILDLYLKTTCEPGRQWAFITFGSAEQAAYAKDATDRVLKFPGSDRTCEVMLAKNQGKFGQAPLSSFNPSSGAAAAAGVAAPGPMFIPMEAGVQPPPPMTPPPTHLTPWRMYRTASGLPYYHNSSTGVTQWEAPPDFQVPGQPALGYVAMAPVQQGLAYPGVAMMPQQRYTPY